MQCAEGKSLPNLIQLLRKIRSVSGDTDFICRRLSILYDVNNYHLKLQRIMWTHLVTIWISMLKTEKWLAMPIT